MPLTNKAAVIFIFEGLQTHLWYVAWQHKLVKSACSYQISKVLIPSLAATTPIVKSVVSSPPRGRRRAEWSPQLLSTLTTLLFLSLRHQRQPQAKEEQIQCKHCTLHPKSARRDGESHLLIASQLPVRLPVGFSYPISTAFFPFPVLLLVWISLLLLCCRLEAWQEESATLLCGP